MRRWQTVLVFSLFAVLAVPTLALATHSNGPGPAQDFLSGSAKGPIATSPPCSANAPGHIHTNGQAEDNVTHEARGNFWVDIDFSALPGGSCIGFTSASFSGEVLCVNSYLLPENSTNWIGRIEAVETQPGGGPGIPGILFAGMYIASRHVDNGSPGTLIGSSTTTDKALGFALNGPPSLPATGPIPCEGGPFNTLLHVPFQTLPITQGNLVTHDGD